MKDDPKVLELADYVRGMDLESVQFLGCGRVSKSLHWFPQTHSHDHFELVYLLDGKTRIDVPGQTVTLALYDLIIYPPNVEHFEVSVPGTAQDAIFMSLRLRTTSELGTSIQVKDRNGQLCWLFERIHEETNQKGSFRQDLIHRYVEAIVLLIQRYYADYQPTESDALTKTLLYIQDHYPEQLTVEKLASLVYVSPSYLSRLFHKRLELSPIRYVNMVRLEVAKRLLISTEMSISEIANQVGLADYRYLGKLLKRETGMSPVAFRNQI